MSRHLVPLVEETTNTEGTGTLSLIGATAGHHSFVEAFGDAGYCWYTILDGAGAWEYGVGQVTDATPDTLSRALVVGSSAGGAKLSLGPGIKLVYCEAAPENAVNNGVTTFGDGDTTPSVKNGGLVFFANNTAATTITQFDDGVGGQEIIIVSSNGNTTLADNANIHNGGASITLTANDVISYLNIGNAWLRIYWSQNG